MNNDILLTDLYQLTMMQAYFKEGMNDTAVFEFFIRRQPEKRQFFLTAGLQQVVEYLTQLHFTSEDIQFLKTQGIFSETFLESLREFRFTGDVNAMPEGTIAFANEPILQIIAPIAEAQIIESRLLNILHMQTLIATKAARCILNSGTKMLVDFGMRRAHGAEAGIYAARASYIAGFAGTATVAAGKEYGIPLYGTMAHSYIQAHSSELTAFENFAISLPQNVVLLIDTYDIEHSASLVTELASKLTAKNIIIKAVRLDSGDLGQHSLNVRKILDDAGLTEVKIFCSGDLDEYKCQQLVAGNFPIDGFGVGTRLTTSNDVPSLDCVYKLQEYAGISKRKRSEGKQTWPGRKQVYRYYATNKQFSHDVIALCDAVENAGQALLQPIIRSGKLITELPTIEAIRQHAAEQLKSLPNELKELDAIYAYKIEISQSLRELAAKLDEETH